MYSSEERTVLNNIRYFPYGSVFILRDKDLDKGTDRYNGIIQKLSADGEKYGIVQGTTISSTRVDNEKCKDYLIDRKLTSTIIVDSIEEAIDLVVGDDDKQILNVLYVMERECTNKHNIKELVLSQSKYENIVAKQYSGITEEEAKDLRDRIVKELVFVGATERIVEDTTKKGEEIQNITETETVDITTMTNGEIFDTLIKRLKRSEKDKLYNIVELSKETIESLEEMSNRIKEVTISKDTIAEFKSLIEGNKQSEEVVNWVEDDNEHRINKIFGFNKEEALMALKSKKALLIQGVPGTGKTLAMVELINEITNGNKDKYKIISFGQSTDYSDFINGISTDGSNWRNTDGIFVSICKEAYKNKNDIYVLGIDEISRGDTEKILGEAMTGLELRGKIITLANGESLIVPNNLYIIGTMNITDKSVTKINAATIQRFSIMKLTPQWNNMRYMELIANGDVKVLETLSLIGSTMCNINEIISRDRFLTDEQIIGTRCITIDNITMDTLLREVRYTLKEIILDAITNATKQTNKEVMTEYTMMLDILESRYTCLDTEK